MRNFFNINRDNETTVRSLLNAISEPDISVEDYRKAFQLIGFELGSLLREEFADVPAQNIMFTFASEDTDWLGRGVLSGINKENGRVSVFWNSRQVIHEDRNRKIEISPIVKSYEEPVEGCRYLVVIKSIINTSCVVKTQLTRMIGKFNPEKIYVMAPVMFKDADKSLAREFPIEIVNKFSYLYFAIDDVREENTVIPGVGGQVYPRLGVGNTSTKNAFMPELVLDRLGIRQQEEFSENNKNKNAGSHQMVGLRETRGKAIDVKMNIEPFVSEQEECWAYISPRRKKAFDEGLRKQENENRR